LLIVTKDYQS